MKKLLSVLALATLLFSACKKDKQMYSYTFYRPILESKNVVRSQMRSLAPQAVDSAGKIYVKGNYVFLNEVDKGFHIIDFSNPASPVNKAFVKVPGNIDIAVRGNYLYADTYNDLVTFDISNPLNVQLVNYDNAVFPDRYYSSGGYYGSSDTSMVVVGYEKVDTAVPWEPYVCLSCDFSGGMPTPTASPQVSNGVGGSMARFALLNDRLYTVGSASLKTFNVTNAADPVFNNSINMNWGIETIFPFKNKLFIGSQSGMYIFSTANPDLPQQEGMFEHVRVCDPVVANDSIAYVTLRSGTACQGFANQLDVLNITDIQNPTLIQTYQMTNPYGLSVDGTTLVVCDGPAGLKFFNAANSQNLQLVSNITSISMPYDVITLNGTALVTANNGLYFINYSNPTLPTVLSHIPFN